MTTIHHRRRYLMTDRAAGTAYVQDWTFGPTNEVVDVNDVEDLTLDLPDDFNPNHVDAVAVSAARAAGYMVFPGLPGDNNDLGGAYEVY